jgi:tryptophanase
MTASAGLYEVTKASYLRSRIGQVQRFAQKIQASGIAVLSPPGGHAVYLEMDDFFSGCNRSPGDFASVGFTIELIRRYGIRAAESGPFGWEWDKKSPEDQQKIPNLVRFALPRHVLSDEHIDYTVQAIKNVHDRRHTIPTVVITRGKDMRLRHFSSGLKPVPVNSDPAGTYMEEASRQLTHLSKAIEQELPAREALLTALSIAGGQAGQQPISKDRDPSAWASNVSCDNTFFEYSVALDQTTGSAELRFLIEAQSESNTLASMQKSALRLNADIEKAYEHTVSGARLAELKSLFFPENAEGTFAAWHSCAASKHGPEWKIYLNPRAANASSNGLSAVREALQKLNMSQAQELLDTIVDDTNSVLYFSLDLSPDPVHARVKVYVSHPDATASQIAEKHARICPDASSYEIQKFCEYMAGGSLGPYRFKPLLSCFAFTSEAPRHPVGTIHFPVVAYADHDAEIQARVEKYMEAASVSPIFEGRYGKMVRAVQRRPLADGRGLHAWVSLKQGKGGKKTNTFYLSPEIYGCV